MFAITYILVQHPLAILCALFLDKIGGVAEKLYSVLIFIPCVIFVVVTSKMWLNIFNQTFGIFNKLIARVGLGAYQTDWLSNPNTSLGIVIFIIIWQGFGFGMLLYYSGIKGIPQEINEACELDGVGEIQKFFHITLPMLLPIIMVSVTLVFITALKQMETIFLTTNGGPGNTSQFLANYLYRKAFRNFKYGYANALSVMFVIFCLIFAIIYGKFINKEI